MSDEQSNGDDEQAVKVELDKDNELERLQPLRVGVDVESLPMDAEHGEKFYNLVVPPWDVLTCTAISGGFPIDDKAFPGRAAAEGVKELPTALGDLKASYGLVAFGHVDTNGDQPLSEKRARAVVALATGDLDEFKALASDDGWDIDVVQYLLLYAGHPPGPLDGEDGPKTQGAVKAYQAEKELKVDGIAGPVTKGQLYTDYLEAHSPKLDAALFHEPKFAGLGSDCPLADVDGANLQNRRVVVFAFKAPRLPTVPSGGELTSFYEKIAKECECEELGPPPTPTGPASKQAAKKGAPFLADCPKQHVGS